MGFAFAALDLDGGSRALDRWVITVGSLSMTGWLLIRLRRRIDALVAQLERASGGAITVSIGAGVTSAGGAGSDELLRRADEATYIAKQGGRDRVAVAG